MLKPSFSDRGKTTIELLQQKLSLTLNSKQSGSVSSNNFSQEKPKSVYAYEKNRTDSKQMPLLFYSQQNNLKAESQGEQNSVNFDDNKKYLKCEF